MNLREAREHLTRWNDSHRVERIDFNPSCIFGPWGWKNALTKEAADGFVGVPEYEPKIKSFLQQLTPSELDHYAIKMIFRMVVGDEVGPGKSTNDSSIAWGQIIEIVSPWHRHNHKERNTLLESKNE